MPHGEPRFSQLRGATHLDWRHLFTFEELFQMFQMPPGLATLLYKQIQIFHEVCEEFGIHYFAEGGTMLGAVRHGGLIPWDDDLDVLVPEAQKDLLMSKAVQDAFHRRGFKVMPNRDYQYEFMPYDPAHPDAWDLSKGFIDIFFGKDQANGMWGYPWCNHPFWIKQDEYQRTRVVSFGPVRIHLLQAAKKAIERYYGPNWKKPLVTHLHHTRLDPRVNLIDLKKPVVFPYCPFGTLKADWDEGAFLQKVPFGTLKADWDEGAFLQKVS
jgi:hypothetical protein